MTKQLYYEDVEVGGQIGPLVKHPTTRQAVKWAGASGDVYELHYDKDFALSQGLSNVIVHGGLKAAITTQLLTDWIGDEGTVKKVGCSWRGMDYPGVDLICQGKVTKKYVQDGEHYVECDVWIENANGERTSIGTGVVTLPARS